jgi:hypothetical protein
MDRCGRLIRNQTEVRLTLGIITASAASVAVAVCNCGASAGVPAATFVRSCQNGVGYGGVTRYGRSQALRVGPLWLGALRALTLASLEPARAGQTRFGALEDIAVLKAGAVVTVEVPPSERAYVGLIYDPSKFRDDGSYRISELDWTVRFVACKDPHFNHGLSQFDGGIVIAGRRCFVLDFYVPGHHAKVERRLPAGC